MIPWTWHQYYFTSVFKDGLTKLWPHKMQVDKNLWAVVWIVDLKFDVQLNVLTVIWLFLTLTNRRPNNVLTLRNVTYVAYVSVIYV